MARSFSSASDYLTRSMGGVALPSEFTMMVRIKPTWSSGDGVAHYLVDLSQDSSNEFLFVKYSDNNFYVGWMIGGTRYGMVVSDSGLFTAGTWATWILTYSSSGGYHALYKNNSLVTDHSTSAFTVPVLTGGRALTLGVWGGNHTQSAAADMAEMAIWSRVVSADERAVLQATGCPLNVPLGLWEYHPLIGRHSPEADLVGGLGLTVTGTSAADHPRVFLPYAQHSHYAASSTIYTLTAETGLFTLAGQPANLRAVRQIAATTGAFTETGQDASLKVARNIVASTGAFTLTGQNASLSVIRKVAAQVGAFVETGIDASLRAIRKVAAAVGSFIITGYNAGMGYDVFAGVQLTLSDAPVLSCSLSDSAVLTLTVSDSLATGEE